MLNETTKLTSTASAKGTRRCPAQWMDGARSRKAVAQEEGEGQEKLEQGQEPPSPQLPLPQREVSGIGSTCSLLGAAALVASAPLPAGGTQQVHESDPATPARGGDSTGGTGGQTSLPVCPHREVGGGSCPG